MLIKLLGFTEIIEIDVFFTYKPIKLLRFTVIIQIDAFFLQLQFTVEISYFEIYNEKIHDLLAPSKKKENKRVQVMIENFFFHVTML